jgi:hypothetical protein
MSKCECVCGCDAEMEMTTRLCRFCDSQTSGWGMSYHERRIQG